MKRLHWVLVGVVAIGVVLGLGISRYWRNLQGLKPAFLPLSESIAERLDGSSNGTELPLAVAPEVSISIFAQGLGGPRVLKQDPAGLLLVSVPGTGQIIGLPDEDGNGKAEAPIAIASGLNEPHGIDFLCNENKVCRLYVAETDRVVSFAYNPETRQAADRQEHIALPSGIGHGTRTILFIDTTGGPKLLTSVGSSCNACVEDDQRRAAVLISSPDGRDLKVFASGLRNSVFMAIHPKTKQVWATEMGRDLLGDDLPPDEINVLEGDRNYGWPYCYGKNVPDTDFDERAIDRCTEAGTFPSKIDLQAHSAPLGLSFVPERGWPKEWSGDLLVAFHGSWNRSEPTGYKLVRMELDETLEFREQHDIVSGWLQPDNTALGRPADILLTQEGVGYLSDDKAGVVYRIQSH